MWCEGTNRIKDNKDKVNCHGERQFGTSFLEKRKRQWQAGRQLSSVLEERSPPRYGEERKMAADGANYFVVCV